MDAETPSIVERLREISPETYGLGEEAAALIESLKEVIPELLEALVFYIKEADKRNPNSGYTEYVGFVAMEKARALLNREQTS